MTTPGLVKPGLIALPQLCDRLERAHRSVLLAQLDRVDRLTQRGATPSASALTHPSIERWGLALQQAAVVPWLVGAWTLSEPWLRAGAWMLAAGMVLFVADMLGVLKHLGVARTPAPAPAPALVR